MAFPVCQPLKNSAGSFLVLKPVLSWSFCTKSFVVYYSPVSSYKMLHKGIPCVLQWTHSCKAKAVHMVTSDLEEN